MISGPSVEQLPAVDTLTDAIRRALAESAAATDPRQARIHHACALLLEHWAEARPLLQLGRWYPGIMNVRDLARAYLDDPPT